MEFIKDMYLGDNIKDIKNIVKKFKKKQSISNIYCICIDEKSNSIIEIIHSHEIHKEVYANKNYIVIGLAQSKNEAKQIVCDIIKEIYKIDNELKDIKSTILSLHKRGENLCRY